MKSLFSTIMNNSLFNFAKRLAMAVVFLSFAVIATATGPGGSSWNAKYYLQVHRHSLSTGSGTVYFAATDGDQHNGNSTNAEGQWVSFAADYNLSQSKQSGWSHVYKDGNAEETSSVTMGGKFTIISDDGSYFDGWYKPEETKLQADGTMDVSVTAEKGLSEKITEHYYAKFMARTYYAYKEPTVNVITIDQNGTVLDEIGGSTPTFTLSPSTVSGIAMGTRVQYDNYFSQTADNNGKDPRATFIYEFSEEPIANEFYDYIGWKDTEGYFNTGLSTQNTYQTTATSENPKAPTSSTIYVVYQMERFNLLEYDAQNDNFAVMQPTEEGNIYKYSYVAQEIGESVFRVLSGKTGTVTTSSTTQYFTTTVEKINGMDIMRVVPNYPTGGVETVEIMVDGEKIAELTITMQTELVTVTLNPAENLEGTYEYKQQTTGDVVSIVNNAPVTKVLVNQSDYTFTFNPLPIEGYVFKRWRIEKGETITYNSTPNLRITFEGGETITPEFESTTDRATFIVNGFPDEIYYDLQAAIEASKTKTKVVAVHTNGVLAQGNYTIDGGVTLLVPGKDPTDGSYDVQIGDLAKNSFDGTGWTQYRTLVVEDNTIIDVVDGNISIYAKLKAGNPGVVAGQPTNFGVVVLGKNCKITVSKGGLYAFGYIIGDNSSEIIMKSGTKVYETFQLADWRGGTATGSIIGIFGVGGMDTEVFAAGQYYAQNIEVPLTLEHGALEYLSIAVDVSYVGTQCANVLFLGEIGKNSNQGFLCLGSNTKITKSYDPNTDRLLVYVQGPSAKLSYMYLDMGVAKLDSRKYIMPITNNIDIVIDGTQLDIDYSVAFMPGSTLKMLTKSEVILEAQKSIYFYDHDERMFSDGSAYWHGGKIVPLTLRPANTWKFTNVTGQKSDGKNIFYKRTEKDLVDAQIVFNGEMTVNGHLYTTLGGANITSDGSGKIVINNVDTKSETYQLFQSGDVSQKSIPLSSPNIKLHNRENTEINTTDFTNSPSTYYKFQNYTNVSTPGTYIYYQTEGIWDSPKAAFSGYKLYNNNDEEIASLRVTQPEEVAQAYVLIQLAQVNNETYTKDNFDISISGVSYALGDVDVIDGYKIKVPIIYTAQNKHNVENGFTGTLTIAHKTISSISETVNLIAYEDYQPEFTVPSSVVVRTSLKSSDGEWHPYPLDIQVLEDNVLTLTEGAAASSAMLDNTITLTGNNQNIVWTATISGTHANQFSFAFGNTTNAIKDAAVLFRPTSDGTKSATLTLTASYTDGSNPEQSFTKQQTISLSGEGFISDNTMEFATIGIIKVGTEFSLLTSVNSKGSLGCTISGNENGIVELVEEKDDNDNVVNYHFKAKKVGSVIISVVQEATDVVVGKEISKTFVVQANIQPLGEDGTCVDSEDIFAKIVADYENVAFVDGENPHIYFTSSEETPLANWIIQFASMPGYIKFTPSGQGQWSIQESPNGMSGSWTDLLTWTELESEKPVFLPISPMSRNISISYNGITPGSIADICIYPLTLLPEANVIYIPIRNGKINEKITFTHNVTNGTINISDGENSWGSQSASVTNLGGILQMYYQTEVAISKSDALPGEYTLTATLGSYTTNFKVIAYNFPYDMPIQSNTWGESDFYHYMNEGSHMLNDHYVKWNAEQKKVVFTTPMDGSSLPERYVVFGFKGYPTDLSFTSQTRDWRIYSSTNAQNWEELTSDIVPTADANGVYTIQRDLYHTAKYVKIVSIENQAELAIENVQIIGNNVVEIIDPTPVDPANPTYAELELNRDENAEAISEFTIFVANLAELKAELNSNEFELRYKSDTDENIWLDLPEGNVLTSTQYDILAANKAGLITFQVKWVGENVVNEGIVYLKNGSDEVLGGIRLVGKKSTITADDANTGIFTGVPNGYYLDGTNGKNKKFEEYTYHEVNVKNAFAADGAPLFDYLFIYGETTAMDNNTTTNDGKVVITQPRTVNSQKYGSNAKTPYYIYKKNDTKKGYDFVQMIENANSSSKASLEKIDHEVVVQGDENKAHYAIKPIGTTPLNVYFTGFCPYATTGFTKDEEGVWYFHGDPGQNLNVYLENCHIYSRNKSEEGGPTEKGKSPSFGGTEVVLGSGAVFIFENTNSNSGSSPFNVTIHTCGHNLLKSNFGCFYNMFANMNAEVTQVSSPVQIRLGKGTDYNTASVTLNFDDLWPIGKTSTGMLESRTNGFLSLRKLVNNAPSIDLGNPNTIVNFNGGQIQLQNAEIVSSNYKTTLAISHRSGQFGNFTQTFAYGIGTDAVGGTVNFNDGTTTVLPMEVTGQYRSFYLMDTEQAKDENGNLKYDEAGNPIMVETNITSCLRTPTKTFVNGGSHCMIRACNHVTSKGGAPKDSNGKELGRYVYTNDENAIPAQGYKYHENVVEQLPTDLAKYGEGATVIIGDDKYELQIVDAEKTWVWINKATFTDPYYIVTPNNFPGNLKFEDGTSLIEYYKSYPNKAYGLQSITPDDKGNLYFWVPGGVVPDVAPEQDKLITVWKACMTEIEAGAMGLSGSIGGETTVEEDEEITNFLYCQLDEDIYNVISEPIDPSVAPEKIEYKYKAPVVDPTGKLSEANKYQKIAPTHVGSNAQEEVTSAHDYEVTNKIYYVTTALADTWMNFTMPFDVEKIWIVEPYSEDKIEEFFNEYQRRLEAGEQVDPLAETKKFQARHNADFAAFFGVAMAVGADHLSFEDIYNNYIDWAKKRADAVYHNAETGETGTGLYTGGDYTLRGKYQLTHYDGSNFNRANFYLYKNIGDWTMTNVAEAGEDPEYEFTTQWQIVPKVEKGGVLMEKGKTYSMLFPFCQGCDAQIDENGEVIVDENGIPVLNARDYWDYWTGKFIIFESTVPKLGETHVIKGSNYIATEKVEDNDWLFDNYISNTNTAMLMGNSTFAMMDLENHSLNNQIYTYNNNERGREIFYPYAEGDPALNPASTFLLTGAATKAKMITRSGRVIYDTINDDNNGNQSGTTGNMPTVGGGNDMFITAIEGGINIAVAAPQVVRVLSSTGSVIFAGTITTATDVLLPTSGIYIISGENEVQKILH